MSAIRQLVSIGGAPLSVEAPTLSHELERMFSPLAAELLRLLDVNNGFFAFESALHLFPAGIPNAGYDLVT